MVYTGEKRSNIRIRSARIASKTAARSVSVVGIVLTLPLKPHFLSDGGWMTCDLKSFSTVFQSYQDYGCVIMKWNGMCNGTPFTI